MLPRPTNISIALIGCGKMGAAMARGWLKTGLIGRIDILDPSPLPAELAKSDIVHYHRSVQTIQVPDVIILAIKPQIMPEVCENIKPLVGENTLILSIAAGQSLSVFESHFGEKQPVVRAMPNTPAAIGKGMIVATSNDNVKTRQKGLADALLSTSGIVEWVSDENLMDAVTALSGSGPAYVFLLIEVLTKAGVSCGLKEEFAAKLARQTVVGSAALAESEPSIEAAKLRKNVTSPGGTTEAAMEVLLGNELQALFDHALNAAKNRSQNLNI